MYVVRHGQASFLSEDYDALSDRGREQMSLLAENWTEKGLSFDSVFVGPRKRHAQSFEALREGYDSKGQSLVRAQVLQGLDEYPVDQYLVPEAWERNRGLDELRPLRDAYQSAEELTEKQRSFHRLFSSIGRKWIAGELIDENVKTWGSFRRSVVEAFHAMTSATGNGRSILVISSAGTIGTLFQLAVDCSDEKALEVGWRIRNASYTKFLFDESRVNLDLFNVMDHLSDETMRTFR